jgi:hypothetical protein
MNGDQTVLHHPGGTNYGYEIHLTYALFRFQHTDSVASSDGKIHLQCFTF